jgi:hypothetical protein
MKAFYHTFLCLPHKEKYQKKSHRCRKKSKNQITPLKEMNSPRLYKSGLKQHFFLNAPFIDFLNDFLLRRVLLFCFAPPNIFSKNL